MVEGARLESVYTGNRIEGSNPSLSAFALRSFSDVGCSHLGEVPAKDNVNSLATADAVRSSSYEALVKVCLLPTKL